MDMINIRCNEHIGNVECLIIIMDLCRIFYHSRHQKIRLHGRTNDQILAVTSHPVYVRRSYSYMRPLVSKIRKKRTEHSPRVIVNGMS